MDADLTWAALRVVLVFGPALFVGALVHRSALRALARPALPVVPRWEPAASPAEVVRA